MSSPGAIDVVVVNYRGWQDTIGALEHLGPWPHGTVRVVDNSDDEAEAARLREALRGRDGVDLVVAGGNLGFGRGCNLAFDRSGAGFLLLLNPDARIAAPDVLALARTMREEPRWGALAPRVWWDPARRFLLPTAFPMTPSVRLATLALAHARVAWPRVARACLARQQRRHAQAAPLPTAFAVGAVLLLRRDAVLRAGGLFDPAYFMFFEDSDLSLRLRRAGFAIGLDPRADAVHEYRHKPSKAAPMAQAERAYYSKHFPVFSRLTGGPQRLDALMPAGFGASWLGENLGRCASADELGARLRGDGVLALSPSPMLLPALFRPLGAEAVPLDADDWRRLEPGRYALLVGAAGDAGNGAVAPPARRTARFAWFERAP
jgi:GT2 family glycosyltransferase